MVIVPAASIETMGVAGAAGGKSGVNDGGVPGQPVDAEGSGKGSPAGGAPVAGGGAIPAGGGGGVPGGDGVPGSGAGTGGGAGGVGAGRGTGAGTTTCPSQPAKAEAISAVARK